jgi:hypothetical protein
LKPLVRLDGRVLEHDTNLHLPTPRQTARELPGPVTDEESEPCDVFAELHDQVAGLLGSPRTGPQGRASNRMA